MADLLTELEKRISKEYVKAEAEIADKYEKHMKSKAKKWNEEHSAMLDKKGGYEGKSDREAEQMFKAWEVSYLGRGEHWVALKEQMAQRMTDAKQTASDYINGVLPKVYVKASNDLATLVQASAMEQGVMGIRFDLLDEATVRNLMLNKSNVISFRTTSVNPKRDYKWNSQRIQNALIQGILQGDSISQMADRFLDVMENNRKSAVRNARTAVTSARSAGKQDRYEDLAKQGCEITKIWVDTHDGMPPERAEHWEASGQEVPYNEPFIVGGEELMYPCDPSGSPQNVYNCRCTMKTGKIKFHSVLSDDKRKSANIRIVEDE